MKNAIVWAVAVAMLAMVSACKTPDLGLGGILDTGSPVAVGPDLNAAPKGSPPAYEGIKLDVVVPIFDPGLPDDPDDYEDEGIWPELRRTEANLFAMKMKESLQRTGAFGDVYVVPDATASGDLYVLGTIEESNGEDVEIEIDVVDITGRKWDSESYSHRVKEAWFRDQRNQGKDPYQPVFDEAAADVARMMKRRGEERLGGIRAVEEMRWASTFSEEAFGPYLEKSWGVYKVNGFPAENDPMLARVRAIKVQDQLFMSRMQTHYEGFRSNTSRSYGIWQEQSMVESKAKREAENRAIGQLIVGTLAIVAGAAAAINDNSVNQNQAVVGAIAAGVGAAVVVESFQTRREMQVHVDALSELGQSFDLEVAPTVIEFENRTVSLTGTTREQYIQWKGFLRQIFDEEKTPEDVILGDANAGSAG